MTISETTLKKFSLVSAKPFAEVLAAVENRMGRPDMKAFFQKMAASASYVAFQGVVHEAAVESGLIQFLRLDMGAALAKDPAVKAFRIVRILVGNPLVMKQMVEHVPEAGSYVPVSILVYESPDGVHLSCDLLESVLAPYGNVGATKIAHELDAKIVTLLTDSAG